MKRTTLILAGLFAAALAYYLLFERGAKSPEDAARDAKRLFSLEDSQIETVRLTRPEGSIRLEATADRKWWMTDPIRARADRSACDGIASALADIERQREVKNEKGQAGLAEMGFAPPRARVEFTVGPKRPTDAADGRTPSDGAATVAEAKNAAKGAGSDTAKEGPRSDLAAAPAASAAATGKSGAAPATAATPSDGSKDAGSRTTRVLEIGAEVPATDSVFVRIEGQDSIQLVPQASVSAFLKPLLGFRDHSMLDVMVLDVHEMRIARPEGDLRFQRHDEDWWIESPLLDVADGSAVQNILSAVTGLRAESFVDELLAPMSTSGETSADRPVAAAAAPGAKEPADSRTKMGLDPPRTKVVLLDKNDREITSVSVGAPIEGAGDKAYVRVRSADGATATGIVSTAALSSLSNTAEDLRSKRALEFRSWETSGLNLVAPGTTLSFVKKDGVWTATAPASLQVDAATVEDTLRNLADVEILSFGAPAGASPASLGLEPPATRIEVQPETPGAPARTLVLGRTAPALESIYARSLGRPGIFTISSSILDRIKGGPTLYAVKAAPPTTPASEPAPESAPTSR